eukprot:CAMPEP_0172302884 /NCGR_PEP_ID=MMETSP1058-20130122/4525_1 /TAXON_ID=83371 /ORGANISM="Detonula confervacea, Strain CCMP 353" /LENGTH=806 /DNA_ID=CAMNT_0013013537 /DNA_START=222 /DNA_END=2642 /DNA_ORIENTATION=+
MSRRHVLEDSDSDGDGSPPASNDFFTAEEKEAIDKCDIQVNSDQGIYSEDLMSRAIARVGEPPLEVVEQEGGESPQSYERYCVKKGQEKEFFERDVYMVHDPKGGGYNSTSPSEETILLEIEAIRRSEKAIKNRMFKNKKTGGMVIFGPWWNYAVGRLLELSSDKSLTAQTFGQYTAVKIIRSLFSFITKDLKECVKPGNLQALSSKMGVDWAENTKTARRVLTHCGPSHFLDKELSVVEAHVESLIQKKTKAVPAASAKSSAQNSATAAAASTAAGASSKTQGNVDVAKKRSDAAKARLAAMRASARQKPASVVGTNDISSPKKAVASTSVSGRESFAQGRDALRPAEPRSRYDAPMHNDVGYGQKPPPERAISNAGYGRNPPAQPSSRSAGAPLQGNTSKLSDDGWGRNRDGDSSIQPVKAKGSWKFARRTLDSNIPVDDAPPAEMPNAQNDRSAPQEVGSRGGAPDRPSAAARNTSSSRVDHNRDQSRGHESRGGGRYDSRSDSSPSRHSESRSSGRYDDRSSDRREDYSRSNSRGGDYGRDASRGDEYRHSRSRDGSSRDYGGSSGYDQGSKQSRSEDHDDREVRPQKRFRPPNETSAPTASAPVPAPAGAGRGRGADVNKPAWMTRQGSTNNGPTGMPRNDNGSAAPGPAVAGMSSNYPTAASGAPAAASMVAPSVARLGAGRGRGAHSNLPAWMTQQGQSSANNAPAGMPSSSMAAPMCGGRGGGVHANGPARMTSQDGATSNLRAGMQQQAPAPSANLNAQALNPSHSVGGLTSNGQGRGRGRGRNLPAWMTNPGLTGP